MKNLIQCSKIRIPSLYESIFSDKAAIVDASLRAIKDKNFPSKQNCIDDATLEIVWYWNFDSTTLGMMDEKHREFPQLRITCWKDDDDETKPIWKTYMEITKNPFEWVPSQVGVHIDFDKEYSSYATAKNYTYSLLEMIGQHTWAIDAIWDWYEKYSNHTSHSAKKMSKSELKKILDKWKI